MQLFLLVSDLNFEMSTINLRHIHPTDLSCLPEVGQSDVCISKLWWFFQSWWCSCVYSDPQMPHVYNLCWFVNHYDTGWWCNNHLEKYESQWEGLSHILWKIKNVWNHQPENIYIYMYKHCIHGAVIIDDLARQWHDCHDLAGPRIPTEVVGSAEWSTVTWSNHIDHPLILTTSSGSKFLTSAESCRIIHRERERKKHINPK